MDIISDAPPRVLPAGIEPPYVNNTFFGNGVVQEFTCGRETGTSVTVRPMPSSVSRYSICMDGLHLRWVRGFHFKGAWPDGSFGWIDFSECAARPDADYDVPGGDHVFSVWCYADDESILVQAFRARFAGCELVPARWWDGKAEHTKRSIRYYLVTSRDVNES